VSSGNQYGLKLNGAHLFLFYVNDAIILRGSEHNIKKTAEHLVVSCEETKPEQMLINLST
jgi:hypothetical protein